MRRMLNDALELVNEVESMGLQAFAVPPAL